MTSSRTNSHHSDATARIRLSVCPANELLFRCSDIAGRPCNQAHKKLSSGQIHLENGWPIEIREYPKYPSLVLRVPVVCNRSTICITLSYFVVHNSFCDQ